MWACVLEQRRAADSSLQRPAQQPAGPGLAHSAARATSSLIYLWILQVHDGADETVKLERLLL